MFVNDILTVGEDDKILVLMQVFDKIYYALQLSGVSRHPT
jgi:hypothetical protein